MILIANLETSILSDETTLDELPVPYSFCQKFVGGLILE